MAENHQATQERIIDILKAHQILLENLVQCNLMLSNEEHAVMRQKIDKIRTLLHASPPESEVKKAA